MPSNTPPKQKVWYDVKIETMIPATMVWRVLADDPEEALEIYRRNPPRDIKYRIHQKKDMKVMVLDAGTTLIKFMKNLF